MLCAPLQLKKLVYSTPILGKVSHFIHGDPNYGVAETVKRVHPIWEFMNFLQEPLLVLVSTYSFTHSLLHCPSAALSPDWVLQRPFTLPTPSIQNSPSASSNVTKVSKPYNHPKNTHNNAPKSTWPIKSASKRCLRRRYLARPEFANG